MYYINWIKIQSEYSRRINRREPFICNNSPEFSRHWKSMEGVEAIRAIASEFVASDCGKDARLAKCPYNNQPRPDDLTYFDLTTPLFGSASRDTRLRFLDWCVGKFGAAEVITCAYCGFQYEPDTPATKHARLTEHIRACPRHPMRRLESKLERALNVLLPFIGILDLNQTALAARAAEIRRVAGWEADPDAMRQLRAITTLRRDPDIPFAEPSIIKAPDMAEVWGRVSHLFPAPGPLMVGDRTLEEYHKEMLGIPPESERTQLRRLLTSGADMRTIRAQAKSMGFGSHNLNEALAELEREWSQHTPKGEEGGRIDED